MATTIAEVYEELLNRSTEAQPRPRVEPTRRAVEILGSPHETFPIIHITGTNGKSSTARISETLLRTMGFRTGLYTSPHLVSFAERIAVDGEPVTEELLVRVYSEAKPLFELVDAQLQAEGTEPLSFFEAATALAFAVFAEAPVDVVVLEVGLGGEWDATNVADADVAVFTPIGLDHVARLGQTLTEIASTKAGIIKPDSIVVSNYQQPEAQAVLEERAKGHTFVQLGKDFVLDKATPAVGGQVISGKGLVSEVSELFMMLFGDYQAENAMVALAAVESLIGGGKVAINPEIIAEAFSTAKSNGRLQRIGILPTVLVDAAHNPHGARALAKAVTENFEFEELILVLGVLSDKDAAGILNELVGIVDQIIITQSGSERAIPAEELSQIAKGYQNVSWIADARSAFATARELASDNPQAGILITGSITLVGEAIAIAEEEGWAP